MPKAKTTTKKTPVKKISTKRKKVEYEETRDSTDYKIKREELDEEQKNAIRKETLTLRIVGIFLPTIYIFWARAYGTFFLFLGITLVLSLDPSGVLGILRVIGSRIWLFQEGSKRAFNNSTGYLKRLI